MEEEALHPLHASRNTHTAGNFLLDAMHSMYGLHAILASANFLAPEASNVGYLSTYSMREDVVAIGRRAASHPWPFIEAHFRNLKGWHLKARHLRPLNL